MSPQTVTNRLQKGDERCRPSCDIRKFDRGLKAILHDELHWMDVRERIEYKLGVMVYRCLPTGTVSLCLAVDSARTAVGRSTMLARQYGTRCQINFF